MVKDWVTSIPYETHLLRAYRMGDESFYVVVMRTVLTQPPYPCAVYHVPVGGDPGHLMDRYGELLQGGSIMADAFMAGPVDGVDNCMPPVDSEFGFSLYYVGEIVANGDIMASVAFCAGGRFARTDTHRWMKVEERGGANDACD